MLVNLDMHAVVEASAGTGKTYTIEKLVVRLLLEKRVPLDKILLVTFTEKATGELKSRLRGALEAELRAQAAPAHGTPETVVRKLLHEALDGFDQAPIFTIHAFCQRLLAEYPVEQGQDLRREHVDDKNLIEPALREVQRRSWCAEYGPKLQQVLELAEYNRSSAKSWEGMVCSLARRFRPGFGDVLRPEGNLDLEARTNACRGLLVKLRECTGPIEDALSHPWCEVFPTLRMHAASRKKKLEHFVQPLLLCLGDPATEKEPLSSLLQFHEQIRKNYRSEFRESGYRGFYTAASEAKPVIDEACPGLEHAIEALEAFRQANGMDSVAQRLAVGTIHAVREQLADIKRERGQCSFDDLIINVHQALAPDNPRARQLIATLHKRYRYAIVDEFQDTDCLQWDIFKRIFLEQGNARLMVVGDPKQAIFGFRGADLPTYLEAARVMKEDFKALSYPLDTNWRTLEELLRPLNQLFDKSGWFPAEKGGYRPVHAPPAEQKRTQAGTDSTGRAPLTLVDLQEAAKPREARLQFARFTAQEIRRLLDGGITFTKQGKQKSLDPADICLLVFKRSEAEPLLEALRAAALPYSFYKQPGVWTSEEAEHLGLILQALAFPDDRATFRKALLTPFFRLTATDLVLCDEIPAHHPARALFYKWLDCAERRQWSALTQSLLGDSGILFQEFADADLDRRFSTLRFLLSTVEEAAYRHNFGLLDLLDFYEQRRGDSDEPESDLHPIETEEPKIQIMTIHASKGLEFPVVFLAGGFTSRQNDTTVTYHDEHRRRVFDLCPDARATAIGKAEEEGDQQRLLYVALTRAMLKLYVPLLRTKGSCGPTATFLGPALEAAELAKLGPKHAQVVDPLKEAAPLTSRASGVAAGKELPPARALDGLLFPVIDRDFGKRRLVVQSFSSLQRAAPRVHFDHEPARAADEGPALSEDPFRGPVFGEIVHDVLEAVDFTEVAAAADLPALFETVSFRASLEEPIAKHLPKIRSRVPPVKLREGCAVKVAELVWQALRTPLPGLEGRLCDIPRAQRVQELEFLFPRLPSVEPPTEVRLEEGFFTGFMDMVFCKDGLYYLLDWKTNDLDAYDEPALEAAMTSSGYHLQFRLYLQALQRWLWRRHGEAFDFLGHVGHVYYLFLRGMTDPVHPLGIYAHKPVPADLDLEGVFGGAHGHHGS